MQSIPIVSAVPLLFSWRNSCSIRFKSGDGLGQSKTLHVFALIISLTELAACFGSLSWCNMKHFPVNLVGFSWILVGKMVSYPSKLILLLSSYMKSSVKLSGPVSETVMHAHAMTPPPPCFTDAWDLLQLPFFLHIFAFPSLRWRFIFVSSVHKHRSKTLLTHFRAFLQTLILSFYIWCWSEVCILL